MTKEVEVRLLGAFDVGHEPSNDLVLLRLRFTDHPEVWYGMNDETAQQLVDALNEHLRLKRTTSLRKQ